MSVRRYFSGSKSHVQKKAVELGRDLYASKSFSNTLKVDIEVRDFIKKRLTNATVGRVVIERPSKNARVTIYSARPGVVIGKKGEEIEQLRTELQERMGLPVHVNIEEIRKPETDAQVIADSIAKQLEKRMMFRRVMKRAMHNAMRLGAQGIKIMSSGRLTGTENARREWYREGRVPLHTLRANIHYGTSEANTTYGVIGIKVWVFKGEVAGQNEWIAIQSKAAPKKDLRKERRNSSVRIRSEAPSYDEEKRALAILPSHISSARVTDIRKIRVRFRSVLREEELAPILMKKAAVVIGNWVSAPKPGMQIAAIGIFPTGSLRTIGEVKRRKDGKAAIAPFNYWALLDPNATTDTPQSVIEKGLELLTFGISVADS